MAVFSYKRIAQFSDTDAAGIVHFSRIACFVEEAEHSFLERAGYPIQMLNQDTFRWPRVQYKATFNRPVFPFESLSVDLYPGHLGKSSILWKWKIRKKNVSDPAAFGEMKTVCCRQSGGQLEKAPLPDDLRALLLSA
ncbi:MAG: acyl-CoA thioesterase [Kiritimatiellia bacterium]